MVKMRSDLDRICEEYATLNHMNNLRVEVESLKKASIINNFQRNVNTRRGAASLLTSFECESEPMGLSPLCNEPVTHRKHSTISPSRRRIAFSVEGTSKMSPLQNSNGSCSPADTITSSDCCPPADTHITAERIISAPVPTPRKDSLETNRNDNSTNVRSSTNDNNMKSFPEIMSQKESGLKSQLSDDDGFILVQKRRLRSRFLGDRAKLLLIQFRTLKQLTSRFRYTFTMYQRRQQFAT